MTKHIDLNNGGYAIVDDDDYDNLNQFNWWDNKGYAYCWQDEKSVSMASMIIGEKEGHEIDHENRVRWDNRKENLRFVTRSQNMKNRNLYQTTRKNASGYKGVHWDKIRQAWKSSIALNGKAKFLGRFETKEEAARAYDEAAKVKYGSRAKLNFPEPCYGIDPPPRTFRIDKNTSGFRGVSWGKSNNKWQAQIKKNQKNYHLGYFKEKEEAAAAYDKAARSLYGVDAVVNFPEAA